MTEGKLNILADEAVVRMAQEGSATAYEYLIQKYREVAKIKARTYYIAGGDNEDAVQEGMIGIFKAVRDYEPGAGASFSSFLELCVDRQIKTAMSGANRRKHKILTAGEMTMPSVPTQIISFNFDTTVFFGFASGFGEI